MNLNGYNSNQIQSTDTKGTQKPLLLPCFMGNSRSMRVTSNTLLLCWMAWQEPLMNGCLGAAHLDEHPPLHVDLVVDVRVALLHPLHLHPHDRTDSTTTPVNLQSPSLFSLPACVPPYLLPAS